MKAHMFFATWIAGSVLATASVSSAVSAEVAPLLAQDLMEMPGKQGALLRVQFAPGESGPLHRHNAYVFVYVLEGSIVMQVRGGKEVTLGPGQTFTELPQDVHTVGRNASKTNPAKFLAFFIKDKDAPPVSPAE